MKCLIQHRIFDSAQVKQIPISIADPYFQSSLFYARNPSPKNQLRHFRDSYRILMFELNYEVTSILKIESREQKFLKNLLQIPFYFKEFPLDSTVLEVILKREVAAVFHSNLIQNETQHEMIGHLVSTFKLMTVYYQNGITREHKECAFATQHVLCFFDQVYFVADGLLKEIQVQLNNKS